MFLSGTMNQDILNELDQTFENVMKTIKQGRNVLLYGQGGVGKSHMIKKIAQDLKNSNILVEITAMTGIAAIGISDANMGIFASTLHRCLGIGTAERDVPFLISKILRNKETKKRIINCQILIIDEISMLGSKLFQKICGVLQGIRKNNSSPTGGIQLILGGDFLQLPPVKDDWVFKTTEWGTLNLRPFILRHPCRYGDANFFYMLARIRLGEPTTQDIRILRQRVKANESMKKIINELKDVDPADIIKPTMFFSRRLDVEAYNDQKLKELPGEAITFLCRDEILYLDDEYKNDDFLKNILDDDMPPSISFKIGSQVMLKVNIRPEDGLVNGSRGVVSAIVPNEALIVKFLNGSTLRIDVYTRLIENKKVKASRTQIPFILADAMTIHKAQGCTLDYCVAELSSCFCDGQAYVALSRCKNIEGLFLSEFTSKSIMCSKEAKGYTKCIEDKEKLENES